MHIVHIDFETYSEIDIWRAGAWAYSAHPSTRILCIAFTTDDGGANLIVPEKLESLKSTLTLETWASREDTIFVAHNAFFEQCIWKNVLIPKYGFLEVPIERWRCSAAKCAALGLPRSLEKAAKALNLQKQKDMSGKNVMLRLSKPRKPTKDNPDIFHDTAKYPDLYDRLYDYCAQDVEVEREIDRKIPNLTDKEQKVWFLDQKINMRGIEIDKELVNSAIDVFSTFENKYTVRIIQATNGYLSEVSRIARIRDWLSDQGVELTDLTKATVNEALLRDDIPENVKFVLKARRQLGRTSIKKFHAMRESIGEGNRLRDLFMYHAASTGRWGGKLVQLQNLPKGSIEDIETCVSLIKQRDPELLEMLYEDVTAAVSSCIRGAIVSKKGYDLIVSDYASIEARVLLWLADDQAALEKIRGGVDLYIDMAQRIYGKEDISLEERALGKVAILGLGYGMGWKKFQATCASYSIHIEDSFAEMVVEKYRKLYKKVCSFWYEQERMAIKAIKSENVSVVGDMGRVTWVKHKSILRCILPSGRPLAYINPRLRASDRVGKQEIVCKGVNSTTNQFAEYKTYGGKLAENVTQAIARDIMAEAMLRCEEVGYHIGMTVHDELIAEVPEGFGSIEEFERLMCVIPTWAQGCPILAKGWRGKRYQKK